MMKLNASYAKKVPAEENFSSQQYHCQIEVELDGGLKPDQIQARIHETFCTVRNAVEAEIQASRQTAPAIQPPQMPPPRPQQYAQPQYQQPMPPQNGYAQQPAPQNGYVQQQPVQQPRQYQQGGAKAKGKNEGNATSKQIEYLLKLMKGSTWTVDGLKLNYNISRLEDLTSEQCSYLIGQLKSNAA